MIPRRRTLTSCWIVFALLPLIAVAASAQSSSRLLLASGSGVPGNPGFVFGPFSGLEMNAQKQIVFLSTIQSERNQRNAIVRSTGVSFSVAVFQGLVSPVARMLFDSFSPPSINAQGDIAFTATLVSMDEGTPPSSGVFRTSGESIQLVAAAGQGGPGVPTPFSEFSAPVIDSSGAVLFGARGSGSETSSGLYLWGGKAIAPVELPADFHLAPDDLLVPVFQSQDESVWVRRSTSRDSALDQFFRAVAIKNFEQLNPPPAASESVTVLGPVPGEKPAQLLLVVLDGEKAETAELQGDPTQPVMGKAPTGSPADLPLASIQGQVPGSVSGSVVFAAAPLPHPDNLGFYCYCGGQATLLASPEDPGINGAGPRSLAAMASDGKQTVAYIASGLVDGTNAIYVTSLP